MMRRGQHGARRGRARVRCDPRWSSSAHRTKRHTELGAEDEEESSTRRISMMRRWLGFPRALTELLGVEDEEEGWGELGAEEWVGAELSTGDGGHKRRRRKNQTALRVRRARPEDLENSEEKSTYLSERLIEVGPYAARLHKMFCVNIN